MSSKDEGAIGVDGTIEWRDAQGRLHRSGGPARVFPSGREEWFRHGRLHREGGPAVIHANGSVKYYLDGVRHREDGPACVYVNGTEKWYHEGKRHRDDGPAAIYPDGRQVWFIEGQRVREERKARQPSAREQRRNRTEPIVDRLGDHHRQLLGLDSRPSHKS